MSKKTSARLLTPVLKASACLFVLAGAAACSNDASRLNDPRFTGSITTANQRDIIKPEVLQSYNVPDQITGRFAPKPTVAPVKYGLQPSSVGPFGKRRQAQAQASNANLQPVRVDSNRPQNVARRFGAGQTSLPVSARQPLPELEDRSVKVASLPNDTRVDVPVQDDIARSPSPQIYTAQTSGGVQPAVTRRAVPETAVSTSTVSQPQGYQSPQVAPKLANVPIPMKGVRKRITSVPASQESGDEFALSSGTYIVRSGDTLSAIASRYGVRIAAIEASNSLSNGNMLRIGQKLSIPPAEYKPSIDVDTATLTPKPKVVAAVGNQPTDIAPKPVAYKAAPKPVTAKVKTEPQPLKVKTVPVVAPKKEAIVEKPVRSASLDVESAPQASAAPQFTWPAFGEIILPFGASADGQVNEGINLKVPEGTSIRSAAAGEVIYASNGLEGFGNLVLIRHENGWVSAYAHAKSLQVKRGDTVRSGQVIARVGSTGSVSSAQLHFELRRGTKPVNPLDHLKS